MILRDIKINQNLNKARKSSLSLVFDFIKAGCKPETLKSLHRNALNQRFSKQD